MSSRPNFALAGEDPQHFGLEASLTYIWDVATLSWIKSTGGGSGGGGAVTVADGADVAEGTTTDVAWVSGAGTVISLLKKIASAGGSAVSIADGSDVAEGATGDAAVVTNTTGTVSGKLRGLVKWAFERMPAALGQTTMANSLPVVLASNQSAIGVSILTAPLDVQQSGGTPWGVTDAGGSLTVDGVFFQATQPVSAAALPLPAGAATSALQTQPGVDIGDVTINNAAGASAVNIQDGGNVITVDGTVVAVTGGLTDAELRATPINISGAISANSSADVFSAEGDAGYTIGDIGKNLTQTDDGRLRVVSAGLISDVPNPYLDGDVRSLSMTNDGRLRVSTTPARYSVPFFSEDEEKMWSDQQVEYAQTGNPWTNW